MSCLSSISALGLEIDEHGNAPLWVAVPNWAGITTPTESARGSGAHFYLTDPQGSPLAIIDAGGFVSERLSYSAYGVPQHHWPEDLDNNGQVDPDDLSDMVTWFYGPGSSSDKSIGGSAYDVDYDISLYGSYSPDMWADFITYLLPGAAWSWWSQRITCDDGYSVELRLLDTAVTDSRMELRL